MGQPHVPQEGGDPQGLHVPPASRRSAQPQHGWPHRAPQSASPPCHLRFLLLITQECISRTWATLHPIVNAARPPPPHLHPRQAQACPLPPAASPNTPVYLWAWPRMECAWLLPTSSPPALTPPLPRPPAHSLPSESLCMWVGGGEPISPSVLSSAGAWPAGGQKEPGAEGSQVAGACGGLAREQDVLWAGRGRASSSKLLPPPTPPSHGSWGTGDHLGDRKVASSLGRAAPNT